MSTKEEPATLPGSGSSSGDSLLAQFCSYTSAHGLGRFQEQAGTFGKALWLCFLLGTYGGFTYHMYSLGLQFASVPLATSLSTSLPFEFPDVYFCPSDAVTMSRLAARFDSYWVIANTRCNAACKMTDLKFNILPAISEELNPLPFKLADGAVALGHVMSEVEANVTTVLQYMGQINSQCRTSQAAEEYTGKISSVPTYSGETAAVRSADLEPFVTFRSCIGWNEAAGELLLMGLNRLADRILDANFADSDRSCRQPPGLPLTAFRDNATSPVHVSIGCLPINNTGANFTELCLHDEMDDLTHEMCARCCYGRKFSHMGLVGNRCYCSPGPANGSAWAAPVIGCVSECPGNYSQVCGSVAEPLMSVFRIANSVAWKRLYLPYRASVSSFNHGPYCFYTDVGGNLAATYCNVPYCPMAASYDCLNGDVDGVFSDSQLQRYTGYRRVSRRREPCLNWAQLKAGLESGTLDYPVTYPKAILYKILNVSIETSDMELNHSYCRSARVELTYMFVFADESFVIRRVTMIDSTWPVCAYVFGKIADFNTCELDTCHGTIRTVTSVIRNQIGGDQLAKQFGSSLGIGLTECSFAGRPCSPVNFQTVLHPQLGPCHRFNKSQFVESIGTSKATDVRLTFSYFTDSTDTFGSQFANLSKTAALLKSGLSESDDTKSALRVAVVPSGQYPRLSDAVSASPGQHTELKLRYDRTVRYPRPPVQPCIRALPPVTYALPTWNTSWEWVARLTWDAANLTALYSTPKWTDKINILKGILNATETGTRPAARAVRFESATQDDCINAYKVKKFLDQCGCLPSFLPIPVGLIDSGHGLCFGEAAGNLSGPELDRLEQCFRTQAGLQAQHERDARSQECPPLCDTRSYSLRQSAYPWPDLTTENAHKFFLNNLGRWSYPYNFLRSRGIASLYYAYLKAYDYSVLNKRASTTFDVRLFDQEVRMVEKRLAKVTVQAASEFGQEVTEEPSYTIRNLMADLGGALGLWSGVSVLTVCELIELIARIAALSVIRRSERSISAKERENSTRRYQTEETFKAAESSGSSTAESGV